MILDALQSLGERGGSSLITIRRQVLEQNPETQRKAAASFNTLTMKALNALVADGKLEREKHTYKLSASFLRSAARRTADLGLSQPDDGEFSGTAAEHNRYLRKLIVDRRSLRDQHLRRHLGLLLPFLPEEGHYLTGRGEADSHPEAKTEEGEPLDGEEIDESSSALVSLQGVPLLQPPSSLKAELHAHQLEGISWMTHMYSLGMPMILGDQMGLGKTVQTIGFIAALREFKEQGGPHLVVVPLSVLSNWMAEIERFCPSLRAIRFHGPKTERERIKHDELSDPQNFDVVVTTFEMLVAESNFFRRKYVWTLVVVDEGHRLKNEKSLLSDKLRMVPALTRVILTGTPLQNNLRELWALLHFLIPDVFGKSTAVNFEEGFDLLRNKIDNTILRKARKMLTLFMLRRIKEQVKIKLPSRRETTILVPLTERQVFWYKHMICGVDEDLIDIVMGADESSRNTDTVDRRAVGADTDYKKLMNLLLQLRKICNHTALMPETDESDDDEDLINGSGKLRMLDRMLPILHEDGHRVLLFSQFTSMLDLLEEYCDERGWSYLRLDGSTNRVQRRLDVRRFNAPRSEIFLFLISTRAGGLGLNLASADTVILYDSDWNPQVDLQAMERAHRIGQTKPVRVYRLICRGSVEERMLSRAEKKLFLNAMVAEASEDDDLEESEESALGIGGGNMTKSELASLIRFGANAICDKGSGEVTDEELALLLERKGRDKYVDQEETVFDTSSIDGVTRRLEMKEIDLRQLGDTQYKKPIAKKPKDEVEDKSFLSDNVRRIRKQRITMVDGAGTGYGGAVPVLREHLDTPKPERHDVKSLRSRQWKHQTFCCLCGTRRNQAEFVVCAHCPKIFHYSCLSKVGLSKSGATFQCPLHKCVACGRSTVASGGLLFRCLGCLTSYCEDCLPQDEIESVGRCKALEDEGYFSNHQAYYIRCPSCCAQEGIRPTGVDGSATINTSECSEADEEPQLWDTQTMRVFSQYTPDSEDEREEKRRLKVEERRRLKEEKSGKRRNVGRPRKINSPFSDSAENKSKQNHKKMSDFEDDALPSPCPVDVPDSCSLAEACDLIVIHPAACHVFESADQNSAKSNSSLAYIRSKILNGKYCFSNHQNFHRFLGRYRNVSAFVSDMRATLKPHKKTVDNFPERQELLYFFEKHVAPVVRL